MNEHQSAEAAIGAAVRDGYATVWRYRDLEGHPWYDYCRRECRPCVAVWTARGGGVLLDSWPTDDPISPELAEAVAAHFRANGWLPIAVGPYRVSASGIPGDRLPEAARWLVALLDGTDPSRLEQIPSIDIRPAGV